VRSLGESRQTASVSSRPYRILLSREVAPATAKVYRTNRFTARPTIRLTPLLVARSPPGCERLARTWNSLGTRGGDANDVESSLEERPADEFAGLLAGNCIGTPF